MNDRRDSVLLDFANTPASAQRPTGIYAPADATLEPKVTVLTPFYNTGAIFHETARSVFQQSFQQWEWLIINDGSNVPEALMVLADYRHRDPRIQVLDHAQNRGLSAARNTGFRAARTPYVVQLDSDDLLEPTAVEKWLWFLESYPEYAFVRGYSVGFGAQEYLWQKGFHDGSAFLEENLVPPTSMIRTVIHEAVGGYDESIHGGLEDWDFWLRCANQGQWGSTVPEYLDWYRRRETHQDRWTNWDDGERQKAFRERLQQRYASLWQTGFPCIQVDDILPSEAILEALPCDKLLAKDRPHLLLILPWLNPHYSNQTDQLDCDIPDYDIFGCLEQLIQRGWAVSVVATHRGEHAGLSRWTKLTPDVFILPHFLRLVDYPRFLHYFMQSRQIDTIVTSSQSFPALLFDYLQTCIDIAFLDWKCVGEDNGATALSTRCEDLFTVGLQAISYLHGWLVTRNAEPNTHACNTGDDAVWNSAHAWLTELEHSKRWIEQQWMSWQQRATQLEQRSAEQHRWIAELEHSKRWLKEQQANLQQRVQEQEDQIAEQRGWIAELEQSKRWDEEQHKNWHQRAQEQEQRNTELQEWIVELEQGKQWLDEQRVQWQAEREQLQKSLWARVGRKLGLMMPRPRSRAAKSD